MKYKKLMLVTLLLLAILTIGAVSAAEDTNGTLTSDNSEELSQDLDDEIVSVEQTDIQTKEIDDNKLNKAPIIDNSTDDSVTDVNGTLILTDIDTGDVVRKNITLTAKANMTDPYAFELNDTVNETVKQLLNIAKIESGGREITITNQYLDVPDSFSRYDNGEYTWMEPDGTVSEKYLLVGGYYGTWWRTNITVEAQYASSDRIISFNATGGEGIMANTSVANNTNYTLPECGFTKEYRIFYGWNVGDAIKQPGENITVTDNIVIKTVWKLDEELGNGNGKIRDYALDLSETSIYCILILTDTGSGEVIVKNITVGPAKSSMTNATAKEGANLHDVAINQLLTIAQIQAGSKEITVKNQTVSNFTADSRYDHRTYDWHESLYEGSDYLIQYSMNDGFTYIGGDYGTKWIGSVILEAEYSSNVVNVANVKVVLSKNTFTYNAKVQKPTVTVINGLILKEGVDFTLQWSADSPKKAGTYTVTVTGIGAYTGTAKVTFKINKAANPLKVKAKTVKVKFSKLKKKAQKLKVTKVVKFTKKGQGTLTYKKVKGNKKITINKKTGKVTIKKGLKKGTYKVKVKIKANGNANYKASAFKTITFKIKIK